MKLKLQSISTAVVVGIFLALMASFGTAGWYSLSASRAELYEQFKHYRESMAQNIANAMADPIYTFSPNNGSLVLELVKPDPRIVRVEIYDVFNEMDFIDFTIPSRRVGNLFEVHHTIEKNGEEIGWVNLTVNDASLLRQLEERKRLFQLVFGLAFLASALVMFPLLYLKLFAPLNRLSAQAKKFQENDLQTSFKWNGNDEISIVGQSLEQARHEMLTLIDELKALSVTDRLTGLVNRNKLDEVIDAEVKRSKRYGSSFGVILLDIDHFKRVNDTHGHQVGDDVLIAFAKILRQNTRDIDTVGRWGGEEFLIICPQTDLNELAQVAEKLRSVVEGHAFPVVQSKTASFGIAVHNPQEGVNELIARSDEALYRAKNNGRNCVEQSA